VPSHLLTCHVAHTELIALSPNCSASTGTLRECDTTVSNVRPRLCDFAMNFARPPKVVPTSSVSALHPH
jgi:hypothetical protein